MLKKQWNKINNIKELQAELIEVENKLAAVNYLDTKLNKNRSILLKRIKKLEEFQKELDDFEVLCELQELDSDLKDEWERMSSYLSNKLSDLELSFLFDKPYDYNNIFLTVHAGAGGTEAQDWAEILSRMYARWASAHDYTLEVIDKLDGDVAGIKRITFSIKSHNNDPLYGLMRLEQGAHRLVRVLPFDAKNRRHTSFAGVEVMPQFDEIGNIEIKDADLEMQTFRSGGPGGQYQNTTDSGVRLIHKPSGIIVESRQERSQKQNRDLCLRLLESKLIQAEQEKRNAELGQFRNDEIAGWGHSIRSYVFMPYQMVKDDRSGYETGKINNFLDGEIDECLKENIYWERQGQS